MLKGKAGEIACVIQHIMYRIRQRRSHLRKQTLSAKIDGLPVAAYDAQNIDWRLKVRYTHRY